jgi:hypothetical protein
MYAHKHGCAWDQETCFVAVGYGHMKYAHENGGPCHEETYHLAALSGHLAMLKCAHDKDCHWDLTACGAGAQKGHVDIFRYAHKNGCP